MKTTFRSLLESGEKFIGCYIMAPCDTDLEIMKMAGVDFVIFDLEHERLTYTEIMPMLRTCEACGLATMIRVPGIDEGAIKKALDMGASAIKVPSISTAEQAKQVVSYCKYPPEGVRGSCPFVRCNGYGIADRSACYEKANREVAVSVIIEGVEGVNYMEEIIAVKGIDAISVGNVDLSCALGVPGQIFHPLVKKAVIHCAELCEKYGKSCSAQVMVPEDAKMFRDCKGISHFLTDLPTAMLYKSYHSLCKGLREYSK